MNGIHKITIIIKAKFVCSVYTVELCKCMKMFVMVMLRYWCVLLLNLLAVEFALNRRCVSIYNSGISTMPQHHHRSCCRRRRQPKWIFRIEWISVECVKFSTQSCNNWKNWTNKTEKKTHTQQNQILFDRLLDQNGCGRARTSPRAAQMSIQQLHDKIASRIMHCQWQRHSGWEKREEKARQEESTGFSIWQKAFVFYVCSFFVYLFICIWFLFSRERNSTLK